MNTIIDYGIQRDPSLLTLTYLENCPWFYAMSPTNPAMPKTRISL